MDLTALAAALLVALGLLGADTLTHSDTVLLSVVVAPPLSKSDRMSLDAGTIALEVEERMKLIAGVPSLAPTPLIHTTQDEGVGEAVFAAINLRHAAEALQNQFGFAPDHIRLVLYLEHGDLRALISGDDRRVGRFETILTAGKDETLLDFVRRCAFWSASRLAPYATVLYLLQQHIGDLDFGEALAIADQAKQQIPPTPVSVDRGLFDNLLGLASLFKNDVAAARASFEAAMKADPGNVAAVLNAAFTELQMGEHAQARERMRRLLEHPPADRVLLASAYTIAAAGALAEQDFAAVDALLDEAVRADADSGAVFELWSEAKRAQGKKEAADRLHARALANTARFQNYGEVALLYFRPAWQAKQAITRSAFGNPGMVH